jgi:hypothetical protein
LPGLCGVFRGGNEGSTSKLPPLTAYSAADILRDSGRCPDFPASRKFLSPFIFWSSGEGVGLCLPEYPGCMSRLEQGATASWQILW